MSTSAPTPSIRSHLWNGDVSPQTYGSREQYHEHILEQYKLYVASAQLTSDRRAQANAFFLTLNTLVLGIAAFVYEKGPRVADNLLNIFPLLVALALCVIWWLLLHSYRQLNRGKFRVIDELESRLPARPFVETEWKILGAGNDFRQYLPFTAVEPFIPVVFGVIYLLMAGTIWWQSTRM